MLTLADLYTALGQPITIPNAGAIHIREVVIDSRQVKLGDLFVALPGEAGKRAGSAAGILSITVSRVGNVVPWRA